MLNKDTDAESDGFRNKAWYSIERVGSVKGRGFELMNDFLACIKKDFYKKT